MPPTASEGGGAHSRKRARSNDRERSRRDERERPRRDEREARPRSRPDGARPPHSTRDERPPEKDAHAIRPDDDLKGGEEAGRRDGRRQPQERRRFRDSFAPPSSDPSSLRSEYGRSALERSELPRSRSFFQHDERRSAGHGSRNMFPRGADKDRWNGPKEQSGANSGDDKSHGNESFKRYEGLPPRSNDDGSWKHDRFYEFETSATRIRPTFREKKTEVREPLPGPNESGVINPTHDVKPGMGADMQDVKGSHNNERERYEQSFVGGNRDFKRSEGIPPGYGNQHRDRYNGTSGGRGRGRDRLVGRQYNVRNPYQPSGFQVAKWKHDLYEEANRSPTPKNEEDKLAKLEALLAS